MEQIMEQTMDKTIKQNELERLHKMYEFEAQIFANGGQFVCGVDEVGRGPLAGPVVVCAVIMPKDCLIGGVNDSKKLTPKKREKLAQQIREVAIDFSFGVVTNSKIDEINILQATYKAMQIALDGLKTKPDHVLIDGNNTPNFGYLQTSIVKGDEKSFTIACASILAKVYRDEMMEQFAIVYPEYSFSSHKGYGTKAHIDAIKTHGLCPIHRRSFLKNYV